MAIKRAKIIEPRQLELMLRYLTGERTEERDKVFLLLSVRGGLRAREISLLPWSAVTNGEGEIVRNIHINSAVAKGERERVVPMKEDLYAALCNLRKMRPDDLRIAYSVKGGHKYMTPNAMVQYFRRYYAKLGFEGLSSHSGRRTFITNLARNCNLVGCSLMDVQRLAGHARVTSTEFYVDYSQNTPEMIERFA